MNTKMLKRGERQVIERCFLFNGVEPELIARTIENEQCSFICLERGSVLADTFDYRQCLGLILHGRVEAVKHSDRRYIMKLLTKGGIFGAASLFDESGGELVTELTALTDCKICIFPAKLLRSIMRADFTVAENYIKFLTSRVKLLNDKIQGLIYQSSDAALAHYILTHAEDSDDGADVRLEVSLSALAEELNMGRASLYRSFEALERGGYIEKNCRNIKITDMEGLKKLGNDAAHNKEGK